MSTPSQAGRDLVALSIASRKRRASATRRIVAAHRVMYPNLAGTDNDVLEHLADKLERQTGTGHAAAS